jgi:hypothetical protein
MTAASVVINRIRTITGDKNSAQWTDAEIINWINDSQMRLISQTESNQEHLVLPSIKDGRNYFLPPGFTKVRAVHVNDLLVSPTTLDEINKMYPAATSAGSYPSGQPIWYWIDQAFSVGLTLQLYPAPDRAGMQIEVMRLQTATMITAPTDQISVPDSQIETLVIMCLQRAKEWDTDFEGAAYFDRISEKRMGEDRYNSQVLQSATYPHIRTATGDDW